jgi:hypothetical protein
MDNRQVVLFVEEAQGMPLDTLEEIRLLSNLETDEHKLLQIILFGQPELDQNLAQRSIRQLRERITHSFELEPLSRDEIHSYLNFRMREVGYTGPELISSNVARKVEQHSAGLLRRINIIADKILLSAYAEGTHNLSPKHVTAAVNDSSFNQEAPRRPRYIWWLLPLLALALAFALYQTRSLWMHYVSVEMLSPTTTAGAVENTPAGAAEARPAAADEASDAPAASAKAQPAEAADAAVAAAAMPVDETPPAADEALPVPADSDALAAADAGSTPPAEADAAAAEPVIREHDGAAPVETTQPQAADAGAGNAAAERTDIDALSAEVDTLLSQVKVAVQQAQGSTPPADAERQASAPAEAEATVSAGERSVPGPNADYRQWLDDKLAQSAQWLSQAGRNKMSIQVMMRNKSAARELVYYLRNEWPLDLSQTYMYEVEIEGRRIYRVFYSEYDTLKQARAQIDLLPQSIKVNSPYVHSIRRMRQALL